MGRGYLIALIVPLAFPVKTTLPECNVATEVYVPSSAETSLKTCEATTKSFREYCPAQTLEMTNTHNNKKVGALFAFRRCILM